MSEFKFKTKKGIEFTGSESLVWSQAGTFAPEEMDKLAELWLEFRGKVQNPKETKPND